MGRKPSVQGAKVQYRRLPSFFKILIADFSDQLRIPPAFKKHLDAAKHVLVNRAGKSWPVEVRKVGADLFFKDGWNLFVQENNLEMGEFLLFHYAARSLEFFVDVYGRTSCLKEPRTATDENNSVTSSSRNEKAEETAKGANQSKSGKGSSSLFKTEAGESVVAINEEDMQGTMVPERAEVSRGLLASGRNSGCNEAASNFHSDYPFFKISMGSAYVQAGFLAIPAHFANAYIKMRSSIRATLQVSDRLMTVKLLKRGNPGRRKYFRFSEGWGAFAVENDLKVGDVCAFELTDEDSLLFKISIFRSAR